MRGILGMIFAVLIGLVALRVVLGVVGGLLGLALGLAWFLLRIGVVVAVIYFAIALVSPATARRLRERVLGPDGA